MTPALRLLGTALVLGLICVPLAGAPRVSAQADGARQPRVSRSWKRIAAGDLTAVGNASERDLRRALVALDDFRFALRRFFPKLQVASEVPTVIVVFSGNDVFHRFKTRDSRGRIQNWVGGYFTAQPDVTYMVMPASARPDETLRILFHEYTHYIVYRNFSFVPLWLNEGLAEFYSTFRSDYRDGRGLIGAPVDFRLGVLRAGVMLPLAEILSNDGAARILRENRRIDMFYAQAWALVHYLHMVRWAKGTADLTTYLRVLRTGSHEDAVRQGFGLSIEELQSELDQYVRKFQFSAVLLPPRPGMAAAKPEAAPMLESDARLLQADLLARLGAEEDAERELKRIPPDDPAGVAARIVLARVRLAQEREPDAVSMLEEAAAADPASFAAHYYLGDALRANDQPEAAIRAYEAALEVQPRAAAAWFGLSSAALALGRDERADAALEEVLALDSNPQWFRRRTFEAFRAARYEAILQDARSYLDQVGWADESASEMAFLAAIACWRLDRPAEAEALLAEAAAAVKPQAWPEKVLRFLQEQITTEALIKAARNDDERTEARFYAGIKASLGGRLDEARSHLQWVKDRGSQHYVEHRLALAELKRLGPGG